MLDPLSCFKAVPPEFLYTETHQPLIMGILNITPDSFSDGGQNNQPGVFEKKAALWADHLIPLIDVGAESTRPGARPLDPAEEIQRLATVFDFVKNREKTPFSPRFSIDTYHFETARKALENGFDLLNDIHGLDDPEMLSLAKEHKDKPCIFMHNRDLTGLPLKNTVEVVEQWLEEKINLFEQNGLCPHDFRSRYRIWKNGLPVFANSAKPFKISPFRRAAAGRTFQKIIYENFHGQTADSKRYGNAWHFNKNRRKNGYSARSHSS